jgi:hypothetical protein
MVQKWSQGQFIKVVETHQKITDEAFMEILNFCKKTNTPYAMQYEGHWKIHGPDNFIKEVMPNDNSSIYNL